MNRTRKLIGLSLVLSASACGAPDERTELDAIETTEEAFGESSCLMAGASAVLDAGDDLLASPTDTQNVNCQKTWIHQFRQFVGSNWMHAFVRWTDPWVRNEVQCRGGVLKIQLQSKTGTRAPSVEPFLDNGAVSFPLVWDAGNGICWYPYVQIDQTSNSSLTALAEYAAPGADAGHDAPLPVFQFFSGSVLGKNTRLAAQALTPKRSTQSVSAQFDTQ